MSLKLMQVWDELLLKELDIPSCMLSEVLEFSGIFGYTTIKNKSISIAGIAGGIIWSMLF